MANLGLVFGCIDIIVTLNGEYCFLEVNEMGQFLWIERANPEIRILDAFCDFLLTVSRTEKNATLLIDKRVRYGDLIEDVEFAQTVSRDREIHNCRDPSMGLAEWYI